GDAGEQADLPTFQEAIAKSDSNHDGKLAQSELPKEWQPTGSWGAIDLDGDDLLNERDWNFFRARRAAQNSLMAIRLGGRGDLSEETYATPAIADGRIYLRTRNTLYCFARERQ